MKRRYVLVSLLLLLIVGAVGANAQSIVVKGKVVSSEDGTPISEALIVIKELNKSELVDAKGRYTIQLQPGVYTIIASCLGYEPHEQQLRLSKDKLPSREVTLDFSLKQQDYELAEANVSARKSNANITSAEMGVERLQMEQIKVIPALMGEVDLIKTLQLLPGVQAAAEGSSGFNVRGGTPDQNLVMLDNTSLYSVSHLLGFFSIFNNDVVSDIQLYKGDIPASQGGRLSSILEVNTKDASYDRISATGGIGTISSRLMVEAPIVKDKLSVFVAARRTYADVFIRLSGNEAFKNTVLYFYDLNGKVAYKVNDKNRIYLTGYMGEDRFGSKNLADMNFGNQLASLRWSRLFSDHFFSDVSINTTKYTYSLTSKIGSQEYTWDSKIRDYGGRIDFTWITSPESTVKFGLSSTYHMFTPGNASISNGEAIMMPKNNALESNVYASHQHKLGSRLTLKYGLRFSLFQNIGPSTSYNFTPEHEKIDSTYYGKGKLYNSYKGFEPRLGVVYELNSSSSVKAAYSRTMQFMHLISNSAAGSPLDIWVPSSPNIQPQLADQASIGYFRNFSDNMFESSLEVYYKKMDNVIDFKDHADVTLSPIFEGELRFGEGESYGFETMVRKNKGSLTGWLSYTYAKAKKTIP